MAAVLSEFARTLLVTDSPVQGLLDELVRHAVDLLPIDAAGVSLVSRQGHPHMVAGSDAHALTYQTMQVELDDGPCLSAFTAEDPVLTPDLSQEQRFPLFASRAHAAGLRAVFAFPLRNAEGPLGALDLYRSTAGALNPHDLMVAHTLADVATVYLLNAETRSERATFVASVAHELRTPMASIVGYGEVLADGSLGPLTPQQRRAVAAIQRNGRRAETLASDLLFAGSLASGKVRAHTSVDLLDVARGARDALATAIEAADVEVGFDLPTEPVIVQGAPEELERMLVNLLGNAIKFTAGDDAGRVRCVVRAVPAVGGVSSRVNIEVSDNGMGIPRAEQAELFTRFFRSSTAEERQIQGTGLGLSIVHSIVRQHGGRIYVDSEHLKGSTFTVHLPWNP
ncbi:MAG: GAF domain-containing sensor histidine kinase [Ornithinimicrobium sp.]